MKLQKFVWCLDIYSDIELEHPEEQAYESGTCNVRFNESWENDMPNFLQSSGQCFGSSRPTDQSEHVY
jgi:hypothetical protein